MCWVRAFNGNDANGVSRRATNDNIFRSLLQICLDFDSQKKLIKTKKMNSLCDSHVLETICLKTITSGYCVYRLSPLLLFCVFVNAR